MGKQDFQDAISASQAADHAVKKNPPKVSIPFMIIFIQEPPGVVKATVTTVEGLREK
jgi:hypothetical protein